MASEEEVLLLTKSIVQTIKVICRDGLACAHQLEISLAGAVRVLVESCPPFIIRFDERVPADAISVESDEGEDIIDLTAERDAAMDTGIDCSGLRSSPGETWLVSSVTQTEVITRDAGTQMLLSMSVETTDVGCQTSCSSLKRSDDKTEHEMLPQSIVDDLPPFVYIDVAADAWNSGTSDVMWRSWKCCDVRCGYVGASNVELAHHYTSRHHCTCFNTMPPVAVPEIDDKSLVIPLLNDASCLPTTSATAEPVALATVESAEADDGCDFNAFQSGIPEPAAGAAAEPVVADVENSNIVGCLETYSAGLQSVLTGTPEHAAGSSTENSVADGSGSKNKGRGAGASAAAAAARWRPLLVETRSAKKLRLAAESERAGVTV